MLAMTSRAGSRFVAAHLPWAILLLALLAAAGCTRPRLYRPDSVVHRDGYDVAFVEFDDQGELWSPAQVVAADRLIRDGSASDHGVILMVFIHGWQHNASPKDGNVAGYESFLGQIAALEQRNRGDQARRVAGVFIGWRGKTTPSRLLAPVTFFSRFRTAKRVAGTAATETILRLMIAGRVNPKNTTVAVGHSFGGLILESALAQTIVGAMSMAMAQDLQEVRVPADLVLLINPASQAIEAKQLIDIFDRYHIKFQREDDAGRVYEVPLVVSMTSSTDLATRLLFPIGMRIKGMATRFRPYGAESCARGRQAQYYRHTAGHERALHSHVVETQPSSEGPHQPLQPEGDIEHPMLRLDYEYDPVSRMQTWVSEGEKLRYEIHQNPRSWNDTPYWVMEVPPTIIPDHSRIFKRETIEFAGTLIAMSGALEAGDRRARLVRDDRVKPVVLATRSDGAVSFLDRSQRIFEIPPGSDQPRFVSCLPDDLTAVEDVLGVSGTGTEAWIAGTVRGVGKNAEENRVDVSRLTPGERGIEAESRSLPKGFESSAAAFDLAGSRLFIAAEHEPTVEVVDLLRKELKPEPLLDLESSDPLRILAYDAERDRLFGSDGQANLLMVDLTATPPAVTTLAEDLDLPAALAYDHGRHRLYVVTAGDGALWKLDCESSCGAPQLLAGPSEVVHPRAIAVDQDGTVWIGDLEVGILVAISPEGTLLRRIDRLPEG